jgi:hypothetical protein
VLALTAVRVLASLGDALTIVTIVLTRSATSSQSRAEYERWLVKRQAARHRQDDHLTVDRLPYSLPELPHSGRIAA